MVLNARKLGLRLDGARVFADVSFDLGDGALLRVDGPSGSGKTALGMTCCGYLPVWAGAYDLAGEIDLLGAPMVQGDVRTDAGIVLDAPAAQLSGMKRTVRDELAFPLECRGVASEDMPGRIDGIAHATGVGGLLDRSLRTLSGGELQRVIVGAALMDAPRFLFLDRPMTEIDEDFRPRLAAFVQDRLGAVNGAALVAEEPWLAAGWRFDGTVMLGGGTDGSAASIEQEARGGDDSPRPHPAGGYLVVDGLAAGYGGVPVFTGVDFGMDAGGLAFIEGPNGAGKTTLAGVLAGMRGPLAGDVRLDGRRYAELKRHEIMRHVGFALQNPAMHLCRATVRAELELGRKWGADPGALVDILDLGRTFDRHPLELTRGELKRLGVALAWGGDTRLVILDEPSQYQDAAGLARVLGAIAHMRQKGAAVLVITHDPRLRMVYADAPAIRLFREDTR